MKNVYWILKVKLRFLATLLLVFAAVYVAAGRYLFYQLPEYKKDLTLILSAALERPVTVESIEGHWAGFDPVIEVNHLKIGGDDPVLIDAINLKLGLWDSLYAQDIRIRSLEVLKTQFEAYQLPGHWKIGGYRIDEAASSEEGAFDESRLDRWLEGASISFIDTQIEVFSRRGDQRQWRLPGISLRYQDDDIYASGQVVQPGSLSPLMRFSYHGKGVETLEHVQGEFFLEARSVDFLDAVLSSYEWEGIGVSEIDASGRIWASFDGFSLSGVQGEMQVSRLDWRSRPGAQTPLRNLAFQFQFQKLDDESSELAWNNLAWQWRDLSCQSSNGLVSMERGVTNFYLDNLDIACLNGLILETDLPEGSLYDRLEISRPSGHLRHLNVVYRQADETGIAEPTPETTYTTVSTADTAVIETATSAPNAADLQSQPADVSSATRSELNSSTLKTEEDRPGFELSIEAELADIALAGYESTPSSEGLNGYLWASADEGYVAFKSDEMSLGFPTLFLSPWQFSNAQGLVHWNIRGDDVDVYSDGLHLEFEGSQLLYGDFQLRLNPDEHEDYLALAIAMQDVPAAKIVDFVPYYEVDADLYEWLQQSLKLGRVESGVFYGYGSVEDDSADNSFTTSLGVDISNIALHFDESWPPLDKLGARVELQNDELWVNAEKAFIHDTELLNLKAHMPSVPVGVDPVLRAEANAQTQGDNLTYWMSESPVAEHTAALGEAIEVEGALSVDIDISVPMGDEDVDYLVKTHFKDNAITHTISGLQFESLSGFVAIDSQEGVNAEGIGLQLFGKAGKLGIESITEIDDDAVLEANGPEAEAETSYTRLILESSANVDDVLAHFELPSVTGLQGIFDYVAHLDFFDDDTMPPRLTLTSEFKGLERDWPLPFQKSGDEREQLSVLAYFDDASTPVNVDLSSKHAGRIDANLLFEGSELKAVDVLLNDKNQRGYQAMQHSGIWIHGELAQAELEPWIDFIESNTPEDEEESSAISLTQLDLLVSEAKAIGQVFKDVQLQMTGNDTGWVARLRGPDIAGLVSLPTDVRTLALELNHIRLDTGGDDDEPDTGKQEANDVDPRTVPALSFSAKKVVIDDQDYGSWSTILNPEENGVRFSRLRGKVGGLKLNGQMNWTVREGHPSTFLELEFDGQNSEKFFEALGKPAPLSSESIAGKTSLVWADHPYEFSAGKLSGKFDLEMKKGFLKTPDQKTGALRLLGIFNADALERRLKLDFSDLYKSGIGYDDLKMRARIDQGRLKFREPMSISGPSSKYEISGTTDLDKQKLNLEMYVELPLSANVPLAALMLGAPQVGGAVWLVDKLLGEPLSSITSVNYRVTGTWDEPKMELR